MLKKILKIVVFFLGVRRFFYLLEFIIFKLIMWNFMLVKLFIRWDVYVYIGVRILKICWLYLV